MLLGTVLSRGVTSGGFVQELGLAGVHYVPTVSLGLASLCIKLFPPYSAE